MGISWISTPTRSRLSPISCVNRPPDVPRATLPDSANHHHAPKVLCPAPKALFSGGGKRAKLPVGGVQGLYSWSILAAKIKSLSVRPLILCVQVVISTFPQASEMSG